MAFFELMCRLEIAKSFTWSGVIAGNCLVQTQRSWALSSRVS